VSERWIRKSRLDEMMKFRGLLEADMMKRYEPHDIMGGWTQRAGVTKHSDANMCI
jgi:ABC-type proline/glycine betaine transport system ATPase subunit